MYKIIVVTYSFLILFQSFNINLEVISKVNALLEHARYHKTVYGDTFFEFLSEHYGENMASHENKHQEHGDLPFKDSHHLCSHINASFALFETIPYSVFSITFRESPLNFFYKEPFSCFEKPAVFQPPKIA